jgi:folate-binding protein YgfZ
MSEATSLHEIAAAAGAVFTDVAEGRVPDHFGDPEGEYRTALTDAVLFDASSDGHIEVTGPEAARFLHNLTTNDIVGLAPGAGCEVFLATHKARAIAYGRVYRLPEANQPTFWLEVGPARGPVIFRHLDRHLISEQLELADRSAEAGSLYVAGPGAAAVLAAAGCNAEGLTPLFGVLTFHPDGVALQLRRKDVLGIPGYTLVAPRPMLAEWWRRLTTAGARPAGRRVYEILRVEAGAPVFGTDIDEERFVVEVGRGAAAISTNKGCYLGQEPIVMARDRGQVNRLLLGVKIADGSPPPHGAKLFQDAAEVGAITTSVVSPRRGVIGLAYIRRGHQTPGTLLQVETADGKRSAEVSSLPFGGATT